MTQAQSPTGPRPAKVNVVLPEAATLTINGKPTRSQSSLRRFISPPLEKGKKYRYTFQANFLRGNQVVRIARTVTLRAGQRKDLLLRLSPTSARSAGRRSTRGRSRGPANPGRVYYYRFRITPEPFIDRFREMTFDGP
jgi:uncharacterized protein (TIGR03000 family)